MVNIRKWLEERKERERVVLMYGPQKYPSVGIIEDELARFDRMMAKKGLLSNEEERIRQLLLKTKELLVEPVIETPEPAKIVSKEENVPIEPEKLSDADILRILTNGNG